MSFSTPLHNPAPRCSLASGLVALSIVLGAACAGDTDSLGDTEPLERPESGSARGTTEAGAGSDIEPFTIRDRDPTEQERACLFEWFARSLPPELQVAVPPEIGRQPTLRAIRTWNGDVVALTWNRAYRVDVESGRLVPIEIPSCPSILDLQESTTELFALCSRHEGPYLLTREKDEHEWEVSLGLREADFLPHGPLAAGASGPWGRLAVSEHSAAVVGTDAYWWRSSESPRWTKHEFALREAPRVFESRLPPEIAFIATDTLLLAWNHGEFESWFYRMELDPEGAPIGQTTRIHMEAVHSIVRDRDGVIWVGGGAGPFGGTAHVLTLEGRTVSAILDEDPSRCEPAGDGLRLPQPAGIQGLAVDAEGRPVVLAGDLGVFRIDGETLSPLFQKRMTREYPLDYGAIMNDRPVGLAVTRSGIFVASRSLGVFAFLEQNGGYEFSQIVRH